MTHAPKTAALIAYDAGALSPAGVRRVDKHLAGCAACRAELAAARLWTTESSRIRVLSDRPPVDFAKMELAIGRAAHDEARARRGAAAGMRLERVLPPLSIAAAVLFTVALHASTAPIARPSGPPAAIWVDAPMPVARVATVARASGDARILRRRSALPTANVPTADVATAGAAIVPNDVLDVGVGELHARFGTGTGLAALDATEVLVREIDLDTITAELVRGRIVVETVSPLGGSSRFVVLAASYRVEAETARFVMDLDAPTGALALEVLEGAVTIVVGGERIELAAPAHWPSDAVEAHAAPPTRVSGLEAGADLWPTLSIERADIASWELDGAAHRGGPSLSARVSAGEHELVGYDASGASFRFQATVGAGGLRIEGGDLLPDGPRIRDGSLPRAVLMSVVGESGGRLTHCYELALRLHALSGDVTARVRLSPRGVVLGVRILSPDAPPSLERCVMAEAERWTFPPPGGPMSFDVPLRFRSR